MHSYAQLNGGGVCVGISFVTEEMEGENLVPLTDEEAAAGDCLGRTYKDGVWGEKPPAPVVPPAPVSTNELREMQLIQMGATAEVYEKQQAEIRLLREEMRILMEALGKGGT